jgi:hypothetical protein
MRRFIPVSIALALAGSTLVAGSTSTSSASEAAQAKLVRTPFALTANSFGTRVIGGAVPVDSSQTAYQSLSCTNKAGINKNNYVAQVDLGSLGTAHGVKSRTWTTKSGGVVSSWAEHSVARITLFNSSFGSLDINGVASTARAYHDASGFHTATTSKIASITYTPKNGKPVGLTIPTVGKPITVPGLLRLSIGASDKRQNADGAQAVAAALDLRVFPLDTKLIVAQTKATIGSGIKSGVFQGTAIGAQAKVLGNLVGVGAAPIEYMPCRGTEGKPLVKETAGVDIAPLLDVDGLYAGVQSAQTNRKASALETAGVATVNLGNGQLIVNGIRAVASVTRVGNKLTRSSEGTHVIEVIVNGESHPLLDQGLEIPGLAKLEGNIVENTRYGLKVVALRITLLDGSLAVIDLGTVNVGIKGSGLKR